MANVKPSNFNYYFESKEKLLQEIYKVTSLELANLINADIGMRRELFIYFIEHPGEQ